MASVARLIVSNWRLAAAFHRFKLPLLVVRAREVPSLAALSVGSHRFFRQNTVVRETNWKLIIDAFLEFYHIKRLHATTVGGFFIDTKAMADWLGPHQRLLVARDSFPDALQLPPEQWCPRLHGTLVHFVFPNSLIVYHPHYTSHMGIYPVSIDRTLFGAVTTEDFILGRFENNVRRFHDPIAASPADARARSAVG